MVATSNKSRVEAVPLGRLAQLLGLVTSREPLAVVLDELVRFAERLAPDMRSSILLADPACGVLRNAAAPSLPTAFTSAIDRLPIADGVGSCGTAAARRELVIVSDIARSPLWNGYAELAAEHGICACWSVPLIDSAGTLLGTCAMYYSQPRAPTPAEEDSIRVIGNLASLVIQRHRDEALLRVSEARYRQLAESCPDAVIVHNNGCILYANGAAAELLQLPDPRMLVNERLERWLTPECGRDLLSLQAGVLGITVYRSDGSLADLEIAASQMSVDGHPGTLLMCRDITDRLALENEVLDAVIREQARFAHDLHDGLGQQLTGISYFLRALSNKLVRQLPAVAEDFEEISALVSKSIEDTRRIASGMSPVAIEQQGFAQALAALAAHAQELYRLHVTVDIDPLYQLPLDSRVATHLYRVVQEALGNVARHAHATLVAITAQINQSELSLSIIDDGIGPPAKSAAGARAGGLGFRIMRYRAQRIGGVFRVDRALPRGTAIVVSCPLRTDQRGPAARGQQGAHRWTAEG